MRLPQELVDAIIDCFGIPYAQAATEKGDSHPPGSQGGGDDLKSLALVSRACNHRARSHLFANYRIYTLDSIKRLDQYPDLLLGYARTLTIAQCYRTPASTTFLPILRRFVSSPLVSIAFHFLRVPEELPEILKSSFPNIRRIDVLSSSLSPSVLLNLVGTLERVHDLRLRRCRLSRATEGDNRPPSLPPLRGRLYISDPHSAIVGLLSQIPLPLRSLCYTSRVFPPEKKIIDACSGSLENLEVRILVDLGG